MSRFNPKAVAVRYGGAVVLTGLALVAALAIRRADVNTNLPFVAAVAISAWYGGRGPGLLATCSRCSPFRPSPRRRQLGVRPG